MTEDSTNKTAILNGDWKITKGTKPIKAEPKDKWDKGWQKIEHEVAYEIAAPDRLDRFWNWLRRRNVKYGTRHMVVSYYMRSDKPVNTTIDMAYVSMIEDGDDG
jgi:hypothetical protein